MQARLEQLPGRWGRLDGGDRPDTSGRTGTHRKPQAVIRPGRIKGLLYIMFIYIQGGPQTTSRNRGKFRLQRASHLDLLQCTMIDYLLAENDFHG